MMAVIICKEFGWTWEEYQTQPASFIETIFDMMNSEAIEGAKKQKSSRH